MVFFIIDHCLEVEPSQWWTVRYCRKKETLTTAVSDAQDPGELVIHLEGDRFHAMFDAAALPVDFEAIIQLALVIWRQFLAEESGDVGRFNGLNKGFQEKGVEGW